jgi:sulfite exporter TauE/SafE
MDYYQALIIGLLGSFHCIGMCGPIAIALPLKENSWWTRVFSGSLYNIGRVITYMALGVVLGLLGMGLALWGVQRWVSVAAGTIMILSVLFPLFFRKLQVESVIDRSLSGFKKFFGSMFGYRTYASTFFIGILNGFLPCGLVYIALAGAIVASSPLAGATYMLLFGLGTIPAMLAVSLLGNVFSLRFRSLIRKVIPFVIVLIGALFILRGLNIGIPYISPKMEQHAKPKCCH